MSAYAKSDTTVNVDVDETLRRTQEANERNRNLTRAETAKLQLATRQLQAIKSLFEAEGSTSSAHYLGTCHVLTEIENG